MNITSAQYVNDDITNQSNISIKIVEDGVTRFVPNNSPANRHYEEIMRQVEAGELTIADAD
jgi:hypothetical protein